MANPSTAHEPSMEEILASIRQIISEDGESAASGRSESRFSAKTEPDDNGGADVPASAAPRAASPLSSSFGAESVAAQEESPKPVAPESPAKAAPSPITPASAAKSSPDVPRRSELSSSAAAPPRQDADPQRAKKASEDRTLLSERSDAVVSGAFSVLAHTILAQNARTLEDLVAEMLRPMLKEWLDENLPSLVEKLVKEEIERVSRGRR